MARKSCSVPCQTGGLRPRSTDVKKPHDAKFNSWDGEQYRYLFQLNPCPILIMDEETLKFLDVNKAAIRLYGYSRKTFLQMTAKDLRPPEDVRSFLSFVRGKNTFRMKFLNNWRHCKLDGTVFNVDLVVSSISFSNRKARLVMVNDMTQRIRKEAELQASEEKLRFALEAANAGTWSWEVASNRSKWDNHFHRHYGFKQNEKQSFEAWITRIHPQDREGLLDRIRMLMDSDSDSVWNEEFRAQLPGKGERWMGGMGRIERDENNRPIRMTGINLDITVRKKAEEALRELTETLEQRVAERTVELRNVNRLLEREIIERKQLQKEIRLLKRMNG